MSKARKSALVRSLTTGQFEAASPATDAGLRNLCVGVVNALQLPLLVMMEAAEDEQAKAVPKAVMAYLVTMAEVHLHYLDPKEDQGPVSPEKAKELVERMQAKWAPVFKQIGGVK
jgi:hypothetical protein